MTNVKFNCLPTIIGSMPHTDPVKACSLVAEYLKDIPAWPQLPKRSFKESMCAQFSQGFPGIVVTENSIYTDRSQDWDEPLEELYTAYLENNVVEIDKNVYGLGVTGGIGFIHFPYKLGAPLGGAKGE